jgi:hypothetical protein
VAVKSINALTIIPLSALRALRGFKRLDRFFNHKGHKEQKEKQFSHRFRHSFHSLLSQIKTVSHRLRPSDSEHRLRQLATSLRQGYARQADFVIHFVHSSHRIKQVFNTKFLSVYERSEICGKQTASMHLSVSNAVRSVAKKV